MESWSKFRSLLIAAVMLVVSLSWVFTLPMTAHYDDLVIERAYFSDPHAQEDIHSIQSRTFTPFTGPLFRGNDHRPLWIRLTLAPSARPDWVVTYQPNFIHRVETWLPESGGDWRLVIAGSASAFSEQAVSALAPSVRVMPNPNAPLMIYARVQTPTTPFFVRVITREDGANFDSLIQLVAGAFIGISLLLALLSFTIFTVTRDKLWLYDVAFNLMGLVLLTLQIGLASRLIWPNSSDLVNVLCLMANCGYLFIMSLLHRQIFHLFQLARWMYVLNTLTLLMFPALIAMIILGHGDVAMQINNTTIFVLSCWGLLIAVLARHPDRLMLTAFRISYIGLILYFIWWSIGVVYQSQTGSLAALYPGFPASLFTMLVLVLMLMRNTQLKMQEAKRLNIEKREFDMQLAFAKQRHEETSNFLGMLLHEVKTPLSIIRMSMNNLEEDPDCQSPTTQRRLQNVHASVDQVNDILQRTIDVDSYEHDGLLFEYAAVDLPSFLQDICAEHAQSARLQLTSPQSLTATSDSHLLGLMVRNLIDNAVKYALAESLIALELVQVAGQWRFSVTNSVGDIGFPDATQLFRKFYRSPLAMRHGGMGLGLYWVRGMAQRMGGNVIYARDQDRVVFTLCMPI